MLASDVNQLTDFSGSQGLTYHVNHSLCSVTSSQALAWYAMQYWVAWFWSALAKQLTLAHARWCN